MKFQNAIAKVMAFFVCYNYFFVSQRKHGEHRDYVFRKGADKISCNLQLVTQKHAVSIWLRNVSWSEVTEPAFFKPPTYLSNPTFSMRQARTHRLCCQIYHRSGLMPAVNY